MGCSLFALFYNNSVQLWRNRFAEASTLHWKGDDIFMSDYQPMTCLPVLALRGLVVFPGCVTHFDVGRTKSVRSVEEAMRANQTIFLVAQRDLETDDPKKADLYEIGTVATVKQILRLPGDNMRILVEGQYRAKLLDMIHSEPYLFGRVVELDEPGYRHDPLRLQALIRQGHELFGQFVDLAVKAGQESMLQILSSDEPGKLADVIGQNATFPYDQKQRILEQLHPVKRLELAIELLAQELDILQLESEISEKVQENVNKNQRDYYLREQIHAIREELGEDDSDDENYAERIRALGLPEATEEKLLREVKRLGRQQGGSPEANVIRNYLDTVLELPWNEETKERLDVKAARKILDADHFGLEKVKERILETLAVRQLAPELPGQILCLVGPPGVGKTSVAISIAKALNRKLARLSLGGVRDEAEIRGHRKTYIGAMPGRIMTAIAAGQEPQSAAAARRGGQARQRLQGRPVVRAARSARSGAEFGRSATTIWRSRSICTAACSSRRPTRPIPSRVPCSTAWRSSSLARIRMRRSCRSQSAICCPSSSKSTASQRRRSACRTTRCARSSRATRANPVSGTSSGSLPRSAGKCAMRFVAEDAPKRISVTGANLEQYLGVRRFLPDPLPAS